MKYVLVMAEFLLRLRLIQLQVFLNDKAG